MRIKAILLAICVISIACIANRNLLEGDDIDDNDQTVDVCFFLDRDTYKVSPIRFLVDAPFGKDEDQSDFVAIDVYTFAAIVQKVRDCNEVIKNKEKCFSAGGVKNE